MHTKAFIALLLAFLPTFVLDAGFGTGNLPGSNNSSSDQTQPQKLTPQQLRKMQLASEAPLPGSYKDATLTGGWFYEPNFGYYYAAPELLGGLNTAGWVYSLWTDWAYVNPRRSDGGFWMWHKKLGWCYMGSQVPGYIWLNESKEWLFFINNNPKDAYFYSFAYDKWTAFNEIPELKLSGYRSFVTNAFDTELISFGITPSTDSNTGTFRISETATENGTTITMTLSGSYDFRPLDLTSGSANMTVWIQNYRIVVKGYSGVFFDGSAEQFYRQYGEKLMDEIAYTLSFVEKNKGTYTGSAKFRGQEQASEYGSFWFE